jgi:hypothetical protein
MQQPSPAPLLLPYHQQQQPLGENIDVCSTNEQYLFTARTGNTVARESARDSLVRLFDLSVWGSPQPATKLIGILKRFFRGVHTWACYIRKRGAPPFPIELVVRNCCIYVQIPTPRLIEGNVHSENMATFDTSLRCVDLAMSSTKPVYDYFAEQQRDGEDPLLFVMAAPAPAPLNYACLNKDNVRGFLTDPTNTFMACTASGTGVPTQLYNKLPFGNFSVYVLRAELQAVMRARTHRVFLVLPPHTTLKRVTSVASANGHAQSHVSGEHCGSGTQKKISTLLKFIIGPRATPSELVRKARTLLDHVQAITCEEQLDWSDGEDTDTTIDPMTEPINEHAFDDEPVSDENNNDENEDEGHIGPIS